MKIGVAHERNTLAVAIELCKRTPPRQLRVGNLTRILARSPAAAGKCCSRSTP